MSFHLQVINQKLQTHLVSQIQHLLGFGVIYLKLTSLEEKIFFCCLSGRTAYSWY